jgi:hypothetical protein
MTKSPEQIDNQEPQQSQTPQEANRPQAELPEWRLWQTQLGRAENGKRREASVRAPDGKTYEIPEGEIFVINRGENGDYEALLRGQDGKETILRESLASRMAKQEQLDKDELAKLHEGLGLEKEASQESSQAQKIFENIYENIAAHNKKLHGEKAVERFVSGISKSEQERKIGIESHVDRAEKATIEQSMQKIEHTEMASKVEQLIKSGELDEFTAKMFIENIRALKTNTFYNDVTWNREKISEDAQENYGSALQSLYSGYKPDQIFEQTGGMGTFYHFNSKESENHPVKNRFYLSGDLSGRPGDMIGAWQKALEQTGMKDKIYFKVPEALSQRQEGVIIYQTENISDEDMGKVMEAFDKMCPQEARAKRDMPSAAAITRGISYAPEPEGLNKMFRDMDLRDSRDENKYLAVSYNEMMAGITQLSFEQAYRDAAKSGNEHPTPKQLKDGASKYFEQMVKLAGINPETMVPNAQGGKLPPWAEKMSKRKK